MSPTFPSSPSGAPRPQASTSTATPSPAAPSHPAPLPPPAPSLPLEPTTNPTREHRSPRRLATLLRWVLIGCVAVAAVNAAASAADYRLIGQLAASPTSVTAAHLDATDHRRVLLSICLLIVSAGAGVLFIAWTSRLYRNLAPLGTRGLRFTEGWAIGAWFVPLLNLVRPKQILNDIWRASEPGAGGDGWQHNRVSPLLHWWWASWVVGLLLVGSSDLVTNDLERIREQLAKDVGAAMALAIGAALALVTVRRLTERQEQYAVTRNAPVLTETAGAASPADARHPSRALPDWLAPIVGVAAFTVALMFFGLAGDAATGSDRAERANDGTIASRGSLLVMDLHVGDCFDDPTGLNPAAPDLVDVVGVEVLPCDVPHDNEVFAKLDHEGGSTAGYPGEAEITEYAVERCIDEFEPWVGLSFDESILDVLFIVPHAKGWGVGDRGIVCAAHRVDLGKLDSSVRDAGI